MDLANLKKIESAIADTTRRLLNNQAAGVDELQRMKVYLYLYACQWFTSHIVVYSLWFFKLVLCCMCLFLLDEVEE